MLNVLDIRLVANAPLHKINLWCITKTFCKHATKVKSIFCFWKTKVNKSQTTIEFNSKQVKPVLLDFCGLALH